MQDFREFRKRPFHSHLGWKKGCKSEWPFGYQCLPGFREHAAAVGYLPFTVFKFPQTQKAHRFRIDSGFCVLFTCRTEDRLSMHGFQAEDISRRSFFAGNLKMKRLHPGLYYRHQKRSGLWKEVTGCLFGMYLLYCFKMTDEWLGWWWKEVCHGEEAQKQPQMLYRPETCVKRKGKEGGHGNQDENL